MSKIPAMLHIRGTQRYQGQDPDVIELTTEGTLELQNATWEIAYEESDLTGLEGVTTCFRVAPRGIILQRTGRLNSRMIFKVGQRHESLYQMDFGTLMIAVKATKIAHEITERGGTVDLCYNIEIEESTAGTVEYHLDIKAI